MSANKLGDSCIDYLQGHSSQINSNKLLISRVSHREWNPVCLCLQEKKIISNCEGVEKTEGEKKVMYKEGQEPASVNKDDLPC